MRLCENNICNVRKERLVIRACKLCPRCQARPPPGYRLAKSRSQTTVPVMARPQAPFTFSSGCLPLQTLAWERSPTRRMRLVRPTVRASQAKPSTLAGRSQAGVSAAGLWPLPAPERTPVQGGRAMTRGHAKADRWLSSNGRWSDLWIFFLQAPLGGLVTLLARGNSFH